eukprot:3521845-Pyramimonas_sp.AAC.3
MSVCQRLHLLSVSANASFYVCRRQHILYVVSQERGANVPGFGVHAFLWDKRMSSVRATNLATIVNAMKPSQPPTVAMLRGPSQALRFARRWGLSKIGGLSCYIFPAAVTFGNGSVL